MKKKKIIKKLYSFCRNKQKKHCDSCILKKENFFPYCDFCNMNKFTLEYVYDKVYHPLGKETKLFKELIRVKKYCHEHSEEDFCIKCKYNDFCCLSPIDWDMDKIKEELTNE